MSKLNMNLSLLVFVCSLVFAGNVWAAQPPDNPIDLKDATQIHAEYYAQGTPRGTLVFLSGDGDGASQGFDPEFAAKCVAFKKQGWNVYAIQSIRWLRKVQAQTSNICLNVSLELKKTIKALTLPVPKACMTLVGFSYGTTLGSVAYSQSPDEWCGLVTLSWCHDIPLEAYHTDVPLCPTFDKKGEFSFVEKDAEVDLNFYSSPKQSLIIQGTADWVCGYTPTDAYLLSTNGVVDDNVDRLVRRVSVQGAHHDLRDPKGRYPWLKTFSDFVQNISN